jgi:ABC-type nitrate/sulfonate/bicarbonate transport system permease component
VFVAIILLGVLGIFFYLIMTLFEYLLIGRRQRSEE